MAVIRDDLDIHSTPCTTPAEALTLRGSIRASYRTLLDLFGEPDFGLSTAADRTVEDATLWMIDTPVGRVQLHNWLGGAYFLARPDTIIRWSVQAATDTALPWIYKVILGSTVTFAEGVSELALCSTRATLTAAYGDYLYLRKLAQARQVALLGPHDPEYRENWTVPRHLGSMAQQVRDIVVHHKWSCADADERSTWTLALGSNEESELERWHRNSLRDYMPISVGDLVQDGARDLTAMLHARATDQVWFRDCILGQTSQDVALARKTELVDEHIGTLRTLATAALAEAGTGSAR